MNERAKQEAVVPVNQNTVWIGRALTTLFALFILGASIAPKLFGLAVAGDTLETLGWPRDAAFPIGILELGCLLLYLWPRTSTFGAILMTGLLGGAMATQFRVEAPLFTHALFGLYLGLAMRAGSGFAIPSYVGSAYGESVPHRQKAARSLEKPQCHFRHISIR